MGLLPQRSEARFGIEMKQGLIAIAAALLLGACGYAGPGSGATASPSPIPPVTTGPQPGYDAAVTEKNQAVSLRVGQKLLVVLHAGANATPWTHPTSSDVTVLTPIVDPAGSVPQGVTVAAFQALAPGDVEVTATAGPKCQAGQPCPMYALLYSLSVRVTA